MKSTSLVVLSALLVVACNQKPTPTDPETVPPVPNSMTEWPEIGTLTLAELDLAGCGMALQAPGAKPLEDGIYLFSGLVNPDVPANSSGTMVMKLDGRGVNFVRTETSGEP